MKNVNKKQLLLLEQLKKCGVMETQDWEPDFDHKFVSYQMPDIPMVHQDSYKLKDFIRSLVEETRKEGYQMALHGEHKLEWLKDFDYQDGFKAGLERAIEAQPFINFNEVISNDMDSFMDGFYYCRARYLENIKKELEK